MFNTTFNNILVLIMTFCSPGGGNHSNSDDGEENNDWPSVGHT